MAAGALNRVIGRGTRCINWMRRSMVFNVGVTCHAVVLYNTCANLLCYETHGLAAGALSRVIDRGTRGIDWTLSSMVFNVVPT
jgi:ABC-type transport system involved in Fe-S cluster assembly fused permease/ATPase subunit